MAPGGGDGIIPTWLGLIQWLEEGAVVGAAAAFIAFIRRHVAQWESRDATVPTDLLDLVVPRDEWSRPDLARLLGIPDDDAVGMLAALGYERVDPVGRTAGSHRRIPTRPP